MIIQGGRLGKVWREFPLGGSAGLDGSAGKSQGGAAEVVESDGDGAGEEAGAAEEAGLEASGGNGGDALGSEERMAGIEGDGFEEGDKGPLGGIGMERCFGERMSLGEGIEVASGCEEIEREEPHGEGDDVASGLAV